MREERGRERERETDSHSFVIYLDRDDVIPPKGKKARMYEREILWKRRGERKRRGEKERSRDEPPHFPFTEYPGY